MAAFTLVVTSLATALLCCHLPFVVSFRRHCRSPASFPVSFLSNSRLIVHVVKCKNGRQDRHESRRDNKNAANHSSRGSQTRERRRPRRPAGPGARPRIPQNRPRERWGRRYAGRSPRGPRLPTLHQGNSSISLPSNLTPNLLKRGRRCSSQIPP